MRFWFRPIITSCLIALAASICSYADPADHDQVVDELLRVIDKLQTNPEAMDAARDAVEKRLTELTEAQRESQQRILDLRGKIESAEKRANEIQVELKSLRAELENSEKVLDDIPDPKVYSDALELIASLPAKKDEPVTPEVVPASAPVTAPTIVAAAAVSAPTSDLALPDASKPIDFNKDIRPILSNNCYACHGFDPKTRKAGLRLDVGEDALKFESNGARALVPGDRNASLVYQRITAHDDDRMPPTDFKKKLSPIQIERIGQWIDQGAKYQGHWSFIPPKRPELPAVQNTQGLRNEIDYFIRARLEEEGLEPSPEADKRSLIRRVTLDLTGLPPTMEEVNAFLADDSPTAYEKVVERLLDSPRYGEHQARYWLDAARYADTNGYHIDNERYMWPWRDWVINAYNDNMPFDQFTIEQIAGDLLPNATPEQKIASGFNRNHMINFEGGAIPEEYRTAYVVDRVVTTSTIWMGLTVNCAQCHDHKYDPISQREFYNLFAFFNTIDETGLDGRDGNAKPLIKAPTDDQQVRLAALEKDIDAVEAEMAKPNPKIAAAQKAWVDEQHAKLSGLWQPIQPQTVESSGGTTFEVLDDHSALASGEAPANDVYTMTGETDLFGITAVRLEALTHESLPSKASGRAYNGNFVLSEFEMEIASKDAPDQKETIKFIRADADFSQQDFQIAKAIDGKADTGWAVEGFKYRDNRAAVFIPSTPFGFPKGTIVTARLKFESPQDGHSIGRFRVSLTKDSSLSAARMANWYVSGPYRAESGDAAYNTDFGHEQGVDLEAAYEDGRMKWSLVVNGYPENKAVRLPGNVAATYLYRKIVSPTKRELTLKLGSNDAVKAWVNGEVVHDKNIQRGLTVGEDAVRIHLNEGDNELLLKFVNYGNEYSFSFGRADEQYGEFALPLMLSLTKPEGERSDIDNGRITRHYRLTFDEEWRTLDAQLAKLTAEKAEVEKAVPTAMVMAEMADPRETKLLIRGQYDQPGDVVLAKTPQALPPMPTQDGVTRLDFANWLMDEQHPLTARVTVNRFWQRYFGQGIVESAEDFGSQGAWPTHPRLLDWLATEFVRSGWDVQHMHRLIVTSAAYRQQSQMRPELQERDPKNLLLARGPRYRLDAEVVRDNALAISGLLNGKVGGPSVKPYQPEGIWEEVAYGANFTAQRFKQDEGDKVYRRSMYTFWKRQAPPPNMMIFDAPNRETCVVRRARTNTPLQALALMNDPQFVEAARVLAEDVMQKSDNIEERITLAFCKATARPPEEKELSVLARIYESQLNDFKANPEDAKNFISVGERPVNENLDPVELGAWTMVMNTILSLDETISKT